MEILSVILSILSASEHFVVPVLFCFSCFIWWRLDKIENRLSAKLENGLMSSITETKIEARSNSVKMDAVLSILKESQSEQTSIHDQLKSDIKEDREKIVCIGERLFGLTERCKAIHGEIHGN